MASNTSMVDEIDRKSIKPVFTIDLEDWNDALHCDSNFHSSEKACDWLEALLYKHKIKAIVYVLENTFPLIVKDWKCIGHIIKTHGKYHRRWENADRRPYQWLGFTGGFWFRLLPLWFIRKQVLKHGMFYCHPHDFDTEHPKLKNPLMNWKRHVGLKTSRKKLERLLQEVKFG